MVNAVVNTHWKSRMRKPKQRYRTTLILATAITLVGIACLITGIVLLVKRNNSVNCETTEGSEKEKSRDKKVERCAFSVEAERCGLDLFLQKVFDTTYELHPFLISTKPKVSAEEVKMKYKAYDPSPSNLKQVTDTAKSLLEELTRKEINEKKLNLRERKALAQLRHFLKHVFGTPFDGNYYFGDFLLGPNVFCWQHICSVGSSLQRSLGFFKPADASGLEVLIEKLTEVDKTFTTYTDNLRFGVKAGMVRSEEECVAGLDAIKRHFLSISVDGPEGL